MRVSAGNLASSACAALHSARVATAVHFMSWSSCLTPRSQCRRIRSVRSAIRCPPSARQQTSLRLAAGAAIVVASRGPRVVSMRWPPMHDMSPPYEGRRGGRRTNGVTHPGRPLADAATTQWTDIDQVARSTIVSRGGRRSRVTFGSWSAEQPGEHTIDIEFYAPVTLRRLRVVFEETAMARTQELTVWVTLHRGEPHREIVRRTCTFDPLASTHAVEDHGCEVEQVSSIQLRIVPDTDGRPRRARIRTLQLVAD